MRPRSPEVSDGAGVLTEVGVILRPGSKRCIREPGSGELLTGSGGPGEVLIPSTCQHPVENIPTLADFGLPKA